MKDTTISVITAEEAMELLESNENFDYEYDFDPDQIEKVLYVKGDITIQGFFKSWVQKKLKEHNVFIDDFGDVKEGMWEDEKITCQEEALVIVEGNLNLEGLNQDINLVVIGDMTCDYFYSSKSFKTITGNVTFKYAYFGEYPAGETSIYNCKVKTPFFINSTHSSDFEVDENTITILLNDSLSEFEADFNEEDISNIIIPELVDEDDYNKLLVNKFVLFLMDGKSPFKNISDKDFSLDFNKKEMIKKISNEISVSFLKDLTQLKSLTLHKNNISDISFLKEFTLDLNLNIKISDYSFLKDLTQLKSLELSENEISDFSFLKNLTQLKSLTLRYNQISDFSFLKDLTQLKSLELSENQISDISFLKNLTQLKSLNLYYNNISDISPLKDLTKLTSLNLSSNKISDISILKDLTKLTSLKLHSNKISDISSLKKLTQLNLLDLSLNNISDISFLKDLTLLTSLNLYHNSISDISFLKDLIQLKKLDLCVNRVNDVSYLGNLKLKKLNINYNGIKERPDFLNEIEEFGNYEGEL